MAKYTWINNRGSGAAKGLELSMLIEYGGKWIELEDPDAGYELHADTYGSRQVTHRKIEVSSEWIEGEYTQRSLRSNVSETVAVWVYARNANGLMDNVDRLTNALDQPSFRIYLQIANNRQVWYCQSADYQIETSQPMLFARQALVRATVPRLPKKVT